MNLARALGTLIVLCALAPWALHGLEWWEIAVREIGHCRDIACDFERIYLSQAELFLDERRGFHKGWVDPPLLAMAMVPFTWLEDPLQWWLGLNACAVLALSWLCALTFRRDPDIRHWSVGLALVLSSLPVLHSLESGQISLIVATLACLGLMSRGGFGGHVLGLIAGLKAYPIAYAILPFTGRRGRFLVGLLFGFAFWALLLPGQELGLDGMKAYAERVWEAAWPSLDHASEGSQALYPTLKRWFVDGSHHGLGRRGALVSPFEFADLIFGAVALLLSIGSYLALRRRRLPHPLKVVIVLCWLGLMLPPGWHHSFAFLPFCMVVLWNLSPRIPTRVAVVLVFAIQQIPVLLLGTQPQIYHWYSAYGGTTIAALLLLLAALELSPRIEPELETPSGLPHLG